MNCLFPGHVYVSQTRGEISLLDIHVILGYIRVFRKNRSVCMKVWENSFVMIFQIFTTAVSLKVLYIGCAYAFGWGGGGGGRDGGEGRLATITITILLIEPSVDFYKLRKHVKWCNLRFIQQIYTDLYSSIINFNISSVSSG